MPFTCLVAAVVVSVATSGVFVAGEFECEPQFAAPAYSAAVMPLEIGLSGNEEQFTLLLPATDL